MNIIQEAYYQNPAVMFELIKILKEREVTFMSPVRDKENFSFRCIKVHNTFFLAEAYNAFYFFHREMNIYFSLARLYNMPTFNYNMQKRMIQQQEFNEKFHNYLISYDMAFDFDAHPDFHVCKRNVKTLKNIFDNYKIPYSLNFSGSGFHIRIPRYFEMEYSAEDNPEKKALIDIKMKEITAIAINLKEIFDLSQMDAKIYDLRRIWKCPFSIDFKTGRVALPLTDEQFENFNYNMVILEKLKPFDIKNRGIELRDGKLENIKKLINEYDLEKLEVELK